MSASPLPALPLPAIPLPAPPPAAGNLQYIGAGRYRAGVPGRDLTVAECRAAGWDIPTLLATGLWELQPAIAPSEDSADASATE